MRQQLEGWIAQRLSFVIETNAASERDYSLFEALKKAGYRLELRYVGLESVAACRKRVAQRVLEGGHDVPPALLEQRYHNSLSLLKTNYRTFDRLQFYDNSETEPMELVDFLPGTSLRQLQPLPVWAASVVAHIVRMEQVYGRLAKE